MSHQQTIPSTILANFNYNSFKKLKIDIFENFFK
jgi:hypothetical protein